MSQDVEGFIRERIKEKDLDHYIMLVQKIKMFIDTNLLELSSKENEEKIQGYFTTLVRLRDLTQSEINDYNVTKNIISILDTYHRSQEVEEKDLETFKELQQTKDQKKT